MLARKALAGTAGAPKVYVEDVFQSWLYVGTGATQTITNGVDISGKGGLVWIKNRDQATSHCLQDSERGSTKTLQSNTTNAEATKSTGVTSFGSTGFTIGDDGDFNENTKKFVSWTFRKAKKFFDVVTYTGNGTSPRTISHNLGSVPGCIIVKSYSTSGENWVVYHRGIANDAETDGIYLNTTGAAIDESGFWNDTAPTSTNFTVGGNLNSSFGGGVQYVAYLFAHDAGGFGDSGDENVISCGSLVSGTVQDIDLGWEPQWIMYKNAGGTGGWTMFDTMRGMTADGSGAYLQANTSAAEATASGQPSPLATGFRWNYTGNSGQTFIYIAIRRGPMKTPEAGTSVFNAIARSGTSSASTSVSGFATDSYWIQQRGGAGYNQVFDRLRGRLKSLQRYDNSAENDNNDTALAFPNNGVSIGADASAWAFNTSGQTYIDYHFRRAPGFFDVVCYTGNATARTISHNLGVAPELMIVKNRSDATGRAWAVYAGDNTDYLVLNTTAATADDNTYWNDTSPTASVFTVGTNNSTNESGDTFVAYLFASLAGVSDIGTYTGNGSSVTVTTDFQPRFIMVKRTDSTGNWIVGDSARGLVSADEPALFLNSTAAETTGQDWVDVSSTGFTVNETALNANVNTATYIYLAIA